MNMTTLHEQGYNYGRVFHNSVDDQQFSEAIDPLHARGYRVGKAVARAMPIYWSEGEPVGLALEPME